MTSWPDYLPSGSQKRFWRELTLRRRGKAIGILGRSSVHTLREMDGLNNIVRHLFADGISPPLCGELCRQVARFRDTLRIMKTKVAPVLIAIALVCFALVQNTQAVSPPPDGGYSSANTAEGQNALQSLTSGVWNTALGYQTLFHDTTGNQNTATGYQALFSNATGSLSVANGSQALYNNTSGSFNTATGFRTLYSNTIGSSNTGNGFEALDFNTTGAQNTADGFNALYNNTVGSGNTAVALPLSFITPPRFDRLSALGRSLGIFLVNLILARARGR